MRAVVQRVSSARVSISGRVHASIRTGLLILIGVEQGDSDQDADYIAGKLVGLRIFDDRDGKMNLSVLDIGGEILAISQFTLLGDARKGRRPSFVRAADPALGNQLYQTVCNLLRERGVPTEQGVFAANMQVELINDGPVTLLVDSRKLF